jgi:hypothetical protein
MTGPMIDHRAEADTGVIFGEDGCSVIDPDGRPVILIPLYLAGRLFGVAPVYKDRVDP